MRYFSSPASCASALPYSNAHLVLALAPFLLLLKRPCSLSRTETAILNQQVRAVYMIYTYLRLKDRLNDWLTD